MLDGLAAVVEPAAALLGQLLEERVGAAARADRRERDPGRLHPGEDLVVLARRRPAVGQQDDVPPGRGGPLERLDRLVEPGEDVRLAVGPDPGDLALQVADVAERLGPDHPVGGLVEADDAELVALGQGRRGPQDRLLADVDLLDAADPGCRRPPVERVAVAGRHRARLVDDDDERDVRLLLAIAHAHVDRQRLLERRLLVAAGAVALGPPIITRPLPRSRT